MNRHKGNDCKERLSLEIPFTSHNFCLIFPVSSDNLYNPCATSPGKGWSPYFTPEMKDVSK